MKSNSIKAIIIALTFIQTQTPANTAIEASTGTTVLASIFAKAHHKAREKWTKKGKTEKNRRRISQTNPRDKRLKGIAFFATFGAQHSEYSSTCLNDLKPLINDPDPLIRAAAAKGFKIICDAHPELEPAFIAHLRDEFKHHTELKDAPDSDGKIEAARFFSTLGIKYGSFRVTCIKELNSMRDNDDSEVEMNVIMNTVLLCSSSHDSHESGLDALRGCPPNILRQIRGLGMQAIDAFELIHNPATKEFFDLLESISSALEEEEKKTDKCLIM